MSISSRLIPAVVALAAVSSLVFASPAAAQTPPVRVGGQIKEPIKIKHVEPVYPNIARAAKVQGVVILEVTVGKDGAVRDARVLRPVALLDSAALDAVQQWQYTPTLLNGEPVDVLMTVTVSFQLRPEPQDQLQDPVLDPTRGVRVGGAIKEPVKIKHVAPVYPRDAIAARVQGIVIIEALIGTDGTVIGAKVLRGVPMLDEAALEAVQQWRYTPTLLNGGPIELRMTVTVNFQLAAE
jgi:protein TonB